MAQLTEQQIRYFETFGCLKFPGLFADDINAITDAFEQTWADFVAKSGRAHDDKHRSSFGPFVDQSEYLSSLLGDPRIGGIASSVLGDDCNFVSSDSAYYVGDTAWHSDRYVEGWDPDTREGGKRPARKNGLDATASSVIAVTLSPMVKMVFYLDPLTRDTGCLRVIPGSHNPGDKFADSVHKGLRDRTGEWWAIGGSEVPALALEVEPGDLVMFHPGIKHASFGGSTRRRGFMYAFEARYEEADLWVLREYMESHNEERYGEKMIGTVSPAGMRHLEQKLAVAEAMRGSVAGVESS
jgi:hypothetical protein